jgi:Uma2 family endonuclease
MQIPKEKLKDHYTYSQYKKWPDEERWEIIEGEAYDMSPAPGITHQRISREISGYIYNFLNEKECEVFIAPFDVYLPQKGESEEKTSTVVQPDISVICEKGKLSEKGCTGAPDIIIEIISSSSASRDQIVKRKLYEKHAVKEYWIVHPVDRIVWKYILIKGQYGKPEVFDYQGKPSFDLFPELVVDLYKVFDVQESDYTKEPSPKPYS